jgi:hypothetical protein
MEYIFKPHDLYVVNKMVEESKLTIAYHVDDLKVRHKSEVVLDEEIIWLETVYGPLPGSRGIQHTYFGMNLSLVSK